jgi:hypothetical protein
MLPSPFAAGDSAAKELREMQAASAADLKIPVSILRELSCSKHSQAYQDYTDLVPSDRYMHNPFALVRHRRLISGQVISENEPPDCEIYGLQR